MGFNRVGEAARAPKRLSGPSLTPEHSAVECAHARLGGMKLSACVYEVGAGDVSATVIAELAARTFPQACPPWLPHNEIAAFVDENLTATRFAAYLADPDAHVFLVGSEEAPLGYALSIHAVHPDGPRCWRTARTAYLSKLYVLVNAHKQGIGAQLLQAVKAAAVADACAAIWLGVNDDNSKARSFYARMGLTVAGKREFHVGREAFTDDIFVAVINESLPVTPSRDNDTSTKGH